MARVNEILVGRYNRFLQKFLSMKGGPPAPQLSSEIMAAWALFHGAENRYLEGWDRFGVLTQQPVGGAGTFVKYQLRNPLGSNVVAVLERVRAVFVSATTLVQAAIANSTVFGADLATAAATVNTRLDARSRPNPTCVLSREASVGSLPGFILDEVSLNATTTQVDSITDENQEWTLLPGDAYRWETPNAVQTYDLVLMWRERFLEESERF